MSIEKKKKRAKKCELNTVVPGAWQWNQRDSLLQWGGTVEINESKCLIGDEE